MPRIIGALLLVLLLAGCGLLKLSYQNADELTFRWLDGYFDFDSAQTRQVRGELDRLHAWHRAEELPRYALLLEQLAQAAPAELTTDAACGWTERLLARIDPLAERTKPVLLAVAQDLQPRQYQQLERKFAQVNAKYVKQWFDRSAADRLVEREKRIVERAERFYGALQPAQLAVLRAQLKTSSFDPAKSLGETRRRQRDTAEALRQLADPAATPAQRDAVLNSWIQRMRHSPDPAHRAYQNAIARESCGTLAALHNSADAAQRARAATQLRGLCAVAA